MSTSKTVPEPTCTCGNKLYRVTEFRCLKCQPLNDRKRLEEAERIIGKLLPTVLEVRETFGRFLSPHDQEVLESRIKDAQAFLESNHSHD